MMKVIPMKKPPLMDSWKNLWSSMMACPSPMGMLASCQRGNVLLYFTCRNILENCLMLLFFKMWLKLSNSYINEIEKLHSSAF